MDLLTAVEQIVDKAKGSGLSSEFYRKAARPIKYVSEKMGLTREQAVMMALFIDNCHDTRIRINDLGRSLECRTTRIIKYWGVPNYGDPTEWREFYSFMENANLAHPEDSAYAYQHMDVPCFIDYLLFELFSANLDWPGNNVKIEQLAPGRPFRMMFYDGDGCFSRVWYLALDHALHSGNNSLVLSRFLGNKEFRFQFCKRYRELSQTYFSYDFLQSLLDEYGQLVEGEITSQYNRFHYPWSVNRYYTDMQLASEFFRDRHEYFREEIKDYLAVGEVSTVDVSCFPNPFTDEIHLLWPSADGQVHEVAIYDVMGRKVFSDICSAEETILKPNLSPGVYMLKVGGYAQRIVCY